MFYKAILLLEILTCEIIILSRVSMDLLSTSPSIGFLGWSSPLARKASQTSLPYYSSLTRPLIDSSSSRELPDPTPTASSAAKPPGFSNPRLSSTHLIPTPNSDPQCSTAQSVFNGTLLWPKSLAFSCGFSSE